MKIFSDECTLVFRRAWKTSLILCACVFSALLISACSDNEAPAQNAPDSLVINDVTGLNPIQVRTIVTPRTLEDIQDTITASSRPISIGGGKFSQGGQTAYEDSIHIDMRSFNQVTDFAPDNKEISVQPGITWRKIQEYIDPYDLSIRIMQTYANFTVGGSLSVNVHGRYIGEGPLINSVLSIKLMLADGSVISASPDENSDLFYGAIGGYGGLGVIVEATLSLTDNTKVERKTERMPITEYAEYFVQNIRTNPDVVFHNGDIYPPKYENVRDVSWYKSDAELTETRRIIPENQDYYWIPKVSEFVADYRIGKWARERIIDPLFYASDRVVWRNWEASYDLRELEPEDRIEKTYVLREYFVPVEKFDEFVPKMREIFQENDTNIINVSIRHAFPDSGSLLSWAPTETFAFVVYYQQGTDEEAKARVRKWSVEMIDAVISVGGTYYLPYQIFASPEQFLAAYPRSPEFFALKKKVDPNNRFRNQLWRAHYPDTSN